jgi:hypothetical protein
MDIYIVLHQDYFDGLTMIQITGDAIEAIKAASQTGASMAQVFKIEIDNPEEVITFVDSYITEEGDVVRRAHGTQIYEHPVL